MREHKHARFVGALVITLMIIRHNIIYMFSPKVSPEEPVSLNETIKHHLNTHPILMNLWRPTHIREKCQHTVTAYAHGSALYLGRCRGGRDLSVGILTIGERHEGVADRVPIETSRGDGPDRGGRAPRTRCQCRREGHSHVAGQEQVLQGDCAWRAMG